VIPEAIQQTENEERKKLKSKPPDGGKLTREMDGKEYE